MRIAIYGGVGGVGSSTAFNLLLGADADSEVILVDSRPAMVESHVLDLEQVLELGGSGVVRRGERGRRAERGRRRLHRRR